MKKSLRSFPAAIQNARFLRQHATIPEQVLWDALRDRRLNGWKFRRQHPIGQFVIDFYCREKSIAIEVNGGVHNQLEVADHDIEREQYLRLRGVKILRFTNRQVLDQLPEVLGEILKIIEE